MSSLHKQLMSKLPARPPLPPPGKSSTGGPRSFGRKRDYMPTTWDKYFESKEDVVCEGNIGVQVFRVYKSGNLGPILLFLHGGGYSGLTWSLLTSELMKLVECQVLAIDLRGHGSTKTTDDSDLSASAMSSDIGQVIVKMFGDESPPLILIGHSMGGAVAVHAAHQNTIPSLLGLVVIDVVEGTALDALQSMQSFLRSRPASFRSIENAVEWCVRSGQVRNLESAKVSMPGQITNLITSHSATEDLSTNFDSAAVSSVTLGATDECRSTSLDCGILEESEEEEDEDGHMVPKKTKVEDGIFRVPTATPGDATRYGWRIDLSKTEKFWNGWFQGLSSMFLSCTPAKMLLLAGVDRLDKELTIGQMQGKFQMQVLPQCGHAVHEDVPDKVAEVLASFLVRNKFVEPTDHFHAVPGC